MTEPASFKELDRAIGAALDADTTNFFELAKLLGLDPKQDFAGADLSGTDLSGGDLSSANFAGTNLKGANLASANLRGAILTNANLSGANLAPRALTLIYALKRSRALARALSLTPARDLTLDFDHGRAFVHDLTHDLTALARDVAPDVARALARALVHANALEQAFFLDLFGARTHARARDHARALCGDLTRARSLLRGANLRGADLLGANLLGASVEGAIMTDCQGLSSAEIAYFKNQGAIFEEALGDHSAVYSPVPR
jgi:uncharacterized protein YjbI with pentapeptide repeats